MSKKTDVKATPEPAAKASTSRVGKPAPWVPGHFPKEWAQFTDAELRKLGLTRPEGADFASTRPEPVEAPPAVEQDAS